MSASAKSGMVYPSGTDSPGLYRTKGRKTVVVEVVVLRNDSSRLTLPLQSETPRHDAIGQRQTMSHIVDTCPLTKCEGGLNLLHEADEDAVIWLEATVTAPLTK